MLEKLTKQEIDELINDLKRIRSNLISKRQLPGVDPTTLDKINPCVEAIASNELTLTEVLELCGIDQDRPNIIKASRVLRHLGFYNKVINTTDRGVARIWFKC